MITGIFYNMVLYQYSDIIITIVVCVLLYKLVQHVIIVRKLNNLDEIPLNEKEKNFQFINRILEHLGTIN